MDRHGPAVGMSRLPSALLASGLSPSDDVAVVAALPAAVSVAAGPPFVAAGPPAAAAAAAVGPPAAAARVARVLGVTDDKSFKLLTKT